MSRQPYAIVVAAAPNPDQADAVLVWVACPAGRECLNVQRWPWQYRGKRKDQPTHRHGVPAGMRPSKGGTFGSRSAHHSPGEPGQYVIHDPDGLVEKVRATAKPQGPEAMRWWRSDDQGGAVVAFRVRRSWGRQGVA